MTFSKAIKYKKEFVDGEKEEKRTFLTQRMEMVGWGGPCFCECEWWKMGR